MSPRIATGLAAVAAVIAAGSGPAWADVPDTGTPGSEPSATAAAPPSAAPTAERSPGHGPSVSPSPSPTADPSPDPSATDAPDPTPGGRSPDPSPGPDGAQPQKDEGDDGRDDTGDSDGTGIDPLQLDDLTPDDLGDHVAEVGYVCTLPDGGTTEETFLWSAWAVPEAPSAGEGVQIGAVFAGDYFWLLDESGKPMEADAVTETGTVRLGGKAAAEDEVDVTVRAEPGDGAFGLDWDFDGTTVETTPERSGRLVLTPGDVRLSVESGGGEAVTDCSPAKAADPLLELRVAEAEAEAEPDDAMVDGGVSAVPGNRAVSTPLGDLPVTGPALLGLAGAGAVSVGAGGTAMFLARKRPGADD
ncbi:hypothetical protein O4J56_28950 [Nocardiopsis sp. RSe5-2]|uniref:Gram-positive cocci surface proteins LPxTG domain-containing protein n=1 Tax=Nocardiopsis endophytica TaxID=3018445 RepID=A0ABT4UEE8_9ACTN|nr:hypothetical protein [Nocardiopsis endophytica]MDA2814707.1 hypothetical protein [Nocardiopsis endophytica]